LIRPNERAAAASTEIGPVVGEWQAMFLRSIFPTNSLWARYVLQGRRGSPCGVALELDDDILAGAAIYLDGGGTLAGPVNVHPAWSGVANGIIDAGNPAGPGKPVWSFG
jgi:hypothetical protein